MDGIESKLNSSPLMAVDALHDEEFDFGKDYSSPDAHIRRGSRSRSVPKEVTLS